jgi:hypothetical protein
MKQATSIVKQNLDFLINIVTLLWKLQQLARGQNIGI